MDNPERRGSPDPAHKSRCCLRWRQQHTPGSQQLRAAPPPPPATSAAATSPSVQPTNRVVFVITGRVPASEFGEVDVTYGSDSDNHDVTLPSLNGTVRYTVPFDGSAQYYAPSVTFTSAGHMTCKIVVKGALPGCPADRKPRQRERRGQWWPLLRTGSTEQLNRHVLVERGVGGVRRCSQRAAVRMPSVRYCLVLHHERSSNGVQPSMAMGREASWWPRRTRAGLTFPGRSLSLSLQFGRCPLPFRDPKWSFPRVPAGSVRTCWWESRSYVPSPSSRLSWCTDGRPGISGSWSDSWLSVCGLRGHSYASNGSWSRSGRLMNWSGSSLN